MDASERLLQPLAVALHTRDREDDYRWLPTAGFTELFGTIRELHRELVADRDATPAETFILMERGERLGLLVANLKTARYDHLRTCIDDTLFLEFTAADRETVLRLAAGLLRPEAQQLHGNLLGYAERRFQELERTGQLQTERLTVALSAPSPDSIEVPSACRIAFRSNEASRRRVAGLLERAATDPHALQRPLVVLSTGFVGTEKLGQQAVHGAHFLALSRSSSLQEGEDVLLDPTGVEKKSTSPVAKTLLASTLVAGLCAASLLGGWAWRNRLSNTPTTPSPDSAKTSTDDRKISDMRQEALRAATLVSLGTTPQGQGGLLVVSALCGQEVRSVPAAR